MQQGSFGHKECRQRHHDPKLKRNDGDNRH